MKKRQFKTDVQNAINRVAKKHKVSIKLNKIETHEKGHFQSILDIDEISNQSDVVKLPLSRKEQVKNLLQEGLKSSSEIAQKIGTHPSYVSKLKSDLRVV